MSLVGIGEILSGLYFFSRPQSHGRLVFWMVYQVPFVCFPLYFSLRVVFPCFGLVIAALFLLVWLTFICLAFADYHVYVWVGLVEFVSTLVLSVTGVYGISGQSGPVEYAILIACVIAGALSSFTFMLDGLQEKFWTRWMQGGCEPSGSFTAYCIDLIATVATSSSTGDGSSEMGL